MSEIVGYGLFVDGKCVSIGQHRSSMSVGNKQVKSIPLYAEPQENYFSDACRLAMELECLMLSCTDTAAYSKWWDSANEALDQHRELLEKAMEKGK